MRSWLRPGSPVILLYFRHQPEGETKIEYEVRDSVPVMHLVNDEGEPDWDEQAQDWCEYQQASRR